MYSIYFRGLLKALAPAFWRKNSLLSYLYSIAKPLQTINDDLMQPFRASVSRLVTFEGTTIKLEKLLNDNYLLPYSPNTRANDIGLASIVYIENVANNNLFYLFNLSEGRPPVYLFNASEGAPPNHLFNIIESTTYPVFIVWVPNILLGTYEVPNTDNNLLLRRLVDTFRIAGTANYLIKRY